jgi:uncharacterized protein YwqG
MIFPENLKTQIENSGFSRLVPHILAHLKPCIKMSLALAGQWNSASATISDQTPIGASKYGGHPDVPPGFEWPLIDGMPLPFMAQIRLEEVAPFDMENALPHEGFLLIFFDTTLEISCETVIYNIENSADLTRMAPPKELPEFGIAEPYALSFSPGWSLPSVSSLEMESIFKQHNASDSEIDAFGEWYYSRSDYHQLLGHCFYEHRDTRYIAASFVTQENDEINGKSEEKWNSDAPKWQCLIQFGSEDASQNSGAVFGVSWGNRNCIYLLIRESELQKRDFQSVFALQ